MDYQKYFNKNGCCVGLVNELTTNIQFCARSHSNPDVVIIPSPELSVEQFQDILSGFPEKDSFTVIHLSGCDSVLDSELFSKPSSDGFGQKPL